MKKAFFILSMLLGSLAFINGQEEKNGQEEFAPLPFGLILAGFLEFGGDEVSEVFFTNGGSQSVHAGQGGTLSAGLRFDLPSLKWWTVDVTAGFKYATTKANNVNIRMTRVPVHLMANYLIDKDFSFGLGLVAHTAVNYFADGVGQDIPFDSAFGPRVELAFRGVGITYTIMKYKNSSRQDYEANAIGLGYTYAFGNK